MKKLMIILSATCFILIGVNTSFALTWNVPGDYLTIQEAIDSASVSIGDTISVGAGNHAGAEVTKSVEIKGESGATINSGPMHPAGLSQGFRMLSGSDGSTISHLRFEADLAIMNGDAVNDVTIDHCTFTNTLQAISNWRGSGWQISHNVITDLRTRNGGGIGILIADYHGDEVRDNVVSHNKVTGTVHVSEIDGGGYNGTGIVLYADFRWGRDGSKLITNNRIVKNKVSLISDTPSVVDVDGIELTEAQKPDGIGLVVIDNAIGFNDLRGTASQLVIGPGLDEPVNKISRNLGENRGHGSHPSIFGPGGK